MKRRGSERMKRVRKNEEEEKNDSKKKKRTSEIRKRLFRMRVKGE